MWTITALMLLTGDPTTGAQRLAPLPAGASPCERLERARDDLGIWIARSMAATDGYGPETKREFAAQLDRYAEGAVPASIADSLRSAATMEEQDGAREERLRAELRVLRDELLVASIGLCS